MDMDLKDQARVEAVWRRVLGSTATKYGSLARREARIGAICRQLHRLGANRALLERLYRQSARRKQALEAMAKLEGEVPSVSQGLSAPADMATLIRELGLAAGDYDPGHPIYGAMFAGFRRDCAQAQNALLRLM